MWCQVAPRLLARGYSPVPIVPGTKRPALAGWQRLCRAPLAPAEIARFGRSGVAYGVGIALGYGGLVAIDVDTDDAAVNAAVEAIAGSPMIAKRGQRGKTIFGRVINDGVIRSRHFSGLVDVLADGTQTVIPPTPHPAGPAYRWTTAATLLDTPLTALPSLGSDLVEKLNVALAPWLPPRHADSAAPLMQAAIIDGDTRRQQCRYADAILTRELAALAAMPPASGRNHAVFRLACRVGRWIHAGITPRERLVNGIIAACEANGLVEEDGVRSIQATIASGLRRSAGDALPDLGGQLRGAD